MDSESKVTTELVHRPDGDVYRVCGLGYCVEHRQRWQAEVIHECLERSHGVVPTRTPSPIQTQGPQPTSEA